MRTGRLLGSGRTADVYELRHDEGESTPPAHTPLTAPGEPTAPESRGDRDGVDRHTGRGPGEVADPGDRADMCGPVGPEGRAGAERPAEAWVLRRYRNADWGDAAAEAEVMAYVRGHGYPVPRVHSATRTEMVLERLSGPTMLEAMATGLLDPARAGATLARLLHALHALPPRDRAMRPPSDRTASGPGKRVAFTRPAPTGAAPTSHVLHLDLHPDNVILTPHGPQVIDWSNAEDGPPGLDWGMSAVILAQVAVDSADLRAGIAQATLVSLLARRSGGPSALTEAGLVEAGRRRAATPTMTARETELIQAAEELVRTLAEPGTMTRARGGRGERP
ncbi:phosphotransferase family protein [Streptomyces bottropensis]|uniref:phosphotransferase family protein n=1 Tax=Streptomyces bottropensis TaxID=42235 RepID=UPI0036C84CB7